jgi:6-phosphogluconolactonase (cycloisomerase 2 family)
MFTNGNSIEDENEGNMEKLLKSQFGLLWLSAVVVLCPALLHAQQYLYTNDSIQFNSGKNSVTAYKVSSKGAVSLIKSYPTGGLGSNGSYFASIDIASGKTASNDCIFASDAYSDDVAAYAIKLADGTLKAAPHSPFKSGGAGAGRGIGLAVAYTSGKPFLFAGNTQSNTITSFQINANCSLKMHKTYNVAGPPVGLKATSGGKYLITAYLGQVDSFKINAKGGLTELGPFSAQGLAAGVEISCDNSTVYFGDAASDMQVEVFGLDSKGKLTELNNFTGNEAVNSNNVMLSADGKTLFVSNTMSAPPAISVLSVGSGGSLTYISTTSLKGSSQYALGLSATKSGAKLFVAETNNNENVGVLKVKGTLLKEVSGSPFSGTQNGFTSFSLVAVPSQSCK